MMKYTTKEIIDNILKFISFSINKNIKNISLGNGYFLFDFGENTVCHFRIDGIEKWKFGIWVIPDENKTKYDISLFGEHNWMIDKFKPSQTSISTTFTFTNKNDMHNINYYCLEVADQIKDIINHPIKEYCNIYYEGFSLDSIKEYINDVYYYTIRKPIYNFLGNQGNIFLSKIYELYIKLRFRNKVKVQLIDENSGSFHCYPRFSFQIVYPKIWDDDKIAEIYYQVPNFKWFNNNCRLGHIIEGDKKGFYFK